MLKRLTLHRFRHVKPGTELLFTGHVNVLLGRNGTGKTTLLNLLSMVLRSDFSELKDEAFDIEYEFTHEHGSGVVRFQNELKQVDAGGPRKRSTSRARAKSQYRPHVAIKLQLERIGGSAEYELEVNGVLLHWRKGSDDWEGSTIVDVFESPMLREIASSFPWLNRDRHAFEANTILHEFSGYGWWAYRFDESLEMFECVTASDAGKKPRPGRAPSIGLEVTFEPGEGHGPTVRLEFVPHWYNPARPEPGQSSTSVKIDSRSSLARFGELVGLVGMTMSFAVEGSHQEADGLWWRFGRAEFLFSAPGGRLFNHNDLSYGQKRLLAFLYYLDANSKFVVADELVNGMHHDWIQACLDEIGERQAFLTSQNPLLLDFLPFENAEQLEKSFIQCRSEIADGRTQIVWSNLAPDDAAELFADYKVGIQPIGEILRARGPR